MSKFHILFSLSLSLFVASSVAGQTVSLEFQVNTYTTDDQKAPDVAKDALGNLIVVWESTGQDGDGQGIFGQRYDSSGVEMAGEFQVNSYTTGYQDQPSVAIGSDSFLVVWRSQGQGGESGEIWAQLYDTGGTEMSTEFHVNSTTAYIQSNPRVISDSAGRYLVVWEDTHRFIGVLGQRFDSTGTSQGVEFLIVEPNAGVGSFDAGMDSGGNFVVVWGGLGDYGPPGYYGANRLRRFDSLGTPVGSTLVFSGTQPDVAVHNGGDFVIAYRFGFIKARRFDSGGTALGGELAVNTYTNYPQVGPRVAMDGDRSFVVSWSSGTRTFPGPDGDDGSIAAQRFTSGGEPWGTEIVVNTYTTGNQTQPAIAADPDGRFVVAWTSNDIFTTGPDGSGTSVRAQRFDPRAGDFADVSVTKDDGLSEAKPGDQVAYTIAVTNGGPNDSTGVSVTDNFPSELEGCSWTSVASGATGNTSGSGNLFDVLEMPAPSSVTYTVDCTIALDATAFSNTADVGGANPDPVPSNNSATDDDTVLLIADLTVTQREDNDPVIVGDPLTYTITVSNAGPLPAESVTVTDVLPAEATLLSAAGTGWLCQDSGPVVLCSRSTLAVGTAPAITVMLEAPLASAVLFVSMIAGEDKASGRSGRISPMRPPVVNS